MEKTDIRRSDDHEDFTRSTEMPQILTIISRVVEDYQKAGYFPQRALK